jgi:hypothetical protein
MKFFSENEDFVTVTKLVPQDKNTVKVKQAPRKVTILQVWGQQRG